MRSFLDLEGFNFLKEDTEKPSRFWKPQRLLDPLRSFLDLEGFEFLKVDTDETFEVFGNLKGFCKNYLSFSKKG